MYSKIKNPITNRFVNINSTLGKIIIDNYLNQLDGSLSGEHCVNGICNLRTRVKDGREEESHMWVVDEEDEYITKSSCNNVCLKNFRFLRRKMIMENGQILQMLMKSVRLKKQ